MITIDYDQLKIRCLSSVDSYLKEGDILYDDGYDILVYKDNKAKILAVAHLDSVLDDTHFERVTLEDRPILFNSQLDDRLGVYFILDVLPKFGLNYDILLTSGEESLNSTASMFNSTKSYNWIFSLDRMGTDVVMYQYDDKKYREMLRDMGIKVGMGSYSDICDLDGLKCAGFNFGIGYQQNHSYLSHMIESDTLHMVNLFIRFFRKYSNKRLPYKGNKYESKHGRYGYKNSKYKNSKWEDSKWEWGDYKLEKWNTCVVCDAPLDDSLSNYCDDCRPLYMTRAES